jgi:hypothetical protein
MLNFPKTRVVRFNVSVTDFFWGDLEDTEGMT